jgi:Uma2 family endonuclease
MATAPDRPRARTVRYPTSDGKPMAETEIHRNDMTDLIQTLEDRYAEKPMVCVSGNMLMFYEEGNRRKHVSPDVFVVLDIPKKERENYLIWEEGKAPDTVIEVTSKSTKREDQKKKHDLYRDVLRVREYFLFDPTQDYLKPPLQGFRLVGDEYIRIKPVDGRLPSEVLGLHLERDGKELRLFDPETRSWLPKRLEREQAAEQRAETANQRAETAEQRLETAEQRVEMAKQEADAAKRAAELAKQEADASKRDAETAKREAETAKRDAETANERAEALQRELEALRRRSEIGQ